METNSWNDTISSVISTPISKILNKITTTEMINFNNQTNNANNTSTDLFETKKDIWTNIENYLTNFYESNYFWPTIGISSYGLIATGIIIGCCIYNSKVSNRKKIWKKRLLKNNEPFFEPLLVHPYLQTEKSSEIKIEINQINQKLDVLTDKINEFVFSKNSQNIENRLNNKFVDDIVEINSEVNQSSTSRNNFFSFFKSPQM